MASPPEASCCLLRLRRSPPAQYLLGRRHDTLRLEAELLLKRLQRRRGPERLHADDVASASDVALPSERGSLFDGDPRRHGGRQPALTVFLRAVGADFPPRRRRDAREGALREQPTVGLHRPTELTAPSGDGQPGLSI